MGKMKNLYFEIEELLKAGLYPVDIAKRMGCTVDIVLQVEEDLYEINQPRNNGADYDQE
jgi:hypothetical protein